MNFCLSLSGGGPKGAAHIGIFKALEENRLIPSSLSGTSAGSLICAMIAVGLNSEEMINNFFIITSNSFRNFGVLFN